MTARPAGRCRPLRRGCTTTNRKRATPAALREAHRRLEVDVVGQLCVEITERIVGERAEVDDGVNPRQLRLRHVPEIDVQCGYLVGWNHEVASVVQPGVEPHDLVSGGDELRHHLDSM